MGNLGMGDDATALCTDCGLCCDGTLYGRVLLGTDTTLPDAEEERLIRRGLRVLRDSPGGSCELEQPCIALRGALCDVYDDRPSACARYACSLRRAVDRGTIPFAEAKSAVSNARDLVGSIRLDLALPANTSIWQGIEALARPESAVEEAAWASAHAASLRAVHDLLVLIRSRFEPKFAGAGVARATE